MSDPQIYKPTAANPYEYSPTQLPPVEPPPTAVAALQDRKPEPGPQLIPGTTAGTVGSIAYLAHNIMRGFAKGRAAAEVNRTAQANRLQTGLETIYNNAAKQYYDLIAGGEDVNQLKSELRNKMMSKAASDWTEDDKQQIAALQSRILRVQQAKSAVDASYAALGKFYGNLVGAFDKSGKKSSSKIWDEDIRDLLTSDNPHEKAAGMYRIMMQSGPPVYQQLAQLQTGQAQQVRQLQQSELTSASNIAQLKGRYEALEQKRASGQQLTDQEQREYQVLSDSPLLFPKMAGSDRKVSQYTGADGKLHLIFERPNGERYETTGEGEVRAGKPREEWSKDGQGFFSIAIDPETNQVIPGTKRYGTPPSSLLNKIRNNEYHWVDDQGLIHGTTVTTSSGPVLPGSQSSAPASASAHQPVHKGGQHLTPPPPITPLPAPSRIIGFKGTPQGQKAIADSYKTYEDALSRYKTMTGNLKDALRGDQQAMISLLANHLGMTSGLQKGMRITRAMWDEAMSSAPWMDRALARFTHVEPDGSRTIISPLKGVVLTPEQMMSMVNLARQKVTTEEEQYKNTLQRFGAPSSPTASPSTTTPPPVSSGPPPTNAKDYLKSLGVH